MTFLSFYFVGSTLSIFTIFFVGMYGYNSLTAIFNVQNGKNFTLKFLFQFFLILNLIVFKPYENQTYSIIQYKLSYMVLNFIIFCFILYRINNMGLLPLTPADWVSFVSETIPSRNLMN